jgi:hypothetical protein
MTRTAASEHWMRPADLRGRRRIDPSLTSPLTGRTLHGLSARLGAHVPRAHTCPDRKIRTFSRTGFRIRRLSRPATLLARVATELCYNRVDGDSGGGRRETDPLHRRADRRAVRRGARAYQETGLRRNPIVNKVVDLPSPERPCLRWQGCSLRWADMLPF